MSDHSSQPSKENAQAESTHGASQPDTQSAEWQGTAAPAESGQRFAETVDRKMESPESADHRVGDGAPASEEDETSIVRPDNS